MKYFIYSLILLFSLSFIFAEEKEKAPEVKKDVFPATLEKATKENKSILLLFTGKEWCGPCQELEKSILSTEKFTSYAKKNIIFLTLDFPESEEPSPENNRLAQAYGIEGFPSMLMTDNKGVAFQRINFEGQSTDVFIAEIDKALKKRSLKTKFSESKDDEEKNKVVKEFLVLKGENDNLMFFAEMIAFGLIQNKELKIEEKLAQLGEILIYTDEKEFAEKLSVEIKKLDPDKKLNSIRFFLIRDLRVILLSHDDDKAYEFFVKNKTSLKGFDLAYFLEFALHLKDHGQIEKSLEILNYLLADEEIKKNKEWNDGLSGQIKEINEFLQKSKAPKATETEPGAKGNKETDKKNEEVKTKEKSEEKPAIKVEVEKVKQD